MKGAIDKASHDRYESDICNQMRWAEDTVNEEEQMEWAEDTVDEEEETEWAEDMANREEQLCSSGEFLATDSGVLTGKPERDEGVGGIFRADITRDSPAMSACILGSLAPVCPMKEGSVAVCPMTKSLAAACPIAECRAAARPVTECRAAACPMTGCRAAACPVTEDPAAA